MKIVVIGKMGSGKSTFSRKLGDSLKIPVSHLDKLYWKPGWIKISREDLMKEVYEIMKNKKWIIDGNFKSTLDMRLAAADTVIFFDINPLVCLYRVFKRAFNKQQLPDKAEGVKERVSWRLIKEIIFYDRDSTIKKINKFMNSKSIYHIRSNSETGEILKRIKKMENLL